MDGFPASLWFQHRPWGVWSRGEALKSVLLACGEVRGAHDNLDAYLPLPAPESES